MTRQSRVVATVLLSATTIILSSSLWSTTTHAEPAKGYVVVEGDSLSRIAAKLGVTLPALLAANQLTVNSLILPGQQLAVPEGAGPAAGGGATYTVKAGDSLSMIAVRHGVSLRALLEVNAMTVQSLIIPDQQLKLPAGATPEAPASAPAAATGLGYTVKAGDSLSMIAARHGVSLRALLDTNGLTVDSLIMPGRQLTLPAGATAPAADVAPSSTNAAGGLSYTVKAGDSLSMIASRHGISLRALLDTNGLTVDSLIMPGRQLTLPAGASQPSTAPAPASSAVDTVLAFALDQRGKPYQFAAAGPDAFDCSGLTKRAFAQAGVKLPHQSALQARLGSPVDLTQDSIRPGDMVFLKTRGSQVINHVGIAVTSTTWIHAVGTGDTVRVTALPSIASIAEVRRFL